MPSIPADEYNDATSGPFIAVVDAAISSGVCNIIQSELSGWVQASILLVEALEEIQKIHPFISSMSFRMCTTFTNFSSCGVALQGGSTT